MTTTISHPALRGQRSHRANRLPLRRRFLTIPGEATGAFWLAAAVVAVLNMIGMVMVMSASSVISVRESGAPWSYFQSQVMWTVVGVGALLVTLSVSLQFWRRLAKPALLASLVALVAVIVPGVGITVNGATRWLGQGSFTFQPSEFAKVSLLLFLADFLAKRANDPDDWRRAVGPVAIYLGLVAGLIMLQPNLGTLIIIAVMVIAMLVASGIRLLPLGVVALVGTAFASFFVFSTDFRRKRFFSFLDPMADKTGIGLQVVQARVALANGGLMGRGLGESTVKWGYLPYAWTDFIYAVLGEEFGLAGALFVVFLFLSLAGLGAFVAFHAADRFSMLVAIGITAWITVQAFMNICAVIGLMPVTGIPLPFISYGGSSQVVNLAALGILLNIARHPAEPGGRGPARAAR